MAKRKRKSTGGAKLGGLVWRSVEDELPDSDLTVLIYGPTMDGDPFLGSYDAEDECFYTVHGRWMEVTHWMEVPKPPGTWFEQAESLTWSIIELARSKQLRSRIDMDDIADDLRKLADQIDEIELTTN